MTAGSNAPQLCDRCGRNPVAPGCRQGFDDLCRSCRFGRDLDSGLPKPVEVRLPQNPWALKLPERAPVEPRGFTGRGGGRPPGPAPQLKLVQHRVTGTCIVVDCANRSMSRQLCSNHYDYFWRCQLLDMVPKPQTRQEILAHAVSEKPGMTAEEMAERLGWKVESVRCAADTCRRLGLLKPAVKNHSRPEFGRLYPTVTPAPPVGKA